MTSAALRALFVPELVAQIIGYIGPSPDVLRQENAFGYQSDTYLGFYTQGSQEDLTTLLQELKDVWVNCRSVCRFWKELVETDPLIQKMTFNHPGTPFTVLSNGEEEPRSTISRDNPPVFFFPVVKWLMQRFWEGQDLPNLNTWSQSDEETDLEIRDSKPLHTFLSSIPAGTPENYPLYNHFVSYPPVSSLVIQVIPTSPIRESTLQNAFGNGVELGNGRLQLLRRQDIGRYRMVREQMFEHHMRISRDEYLLSVPSGIRVHDLLGATRGICQTIERTGEKNKVHIDIHALNFALVDKLEGEINVIEIAFGRWSGKPRGGRPWTESTQVTCIDRKKKFVVRLNALEARPPNLGSLSVIDDRFVW